MKNEWIHNCNYANRHKRAQSMQAFPKWQNGNRQGGKYVLKGEGKTFVGWGTYFILLNQFVRFFLAPRYQKSRVFPCKLPSLISLSDVLHCTTTHQRPSVRWAKGSKPRWERRPCTPEHRGLPHSLSCQTEGRKRRNTSRKISTGSVIYDDLCRAPRLPHYESCWFPSSSLSFLLPCFIPLSVCFPPVYLSVMFAVHLHTPPSSSSSSLIPAHTLTKTAVCQLFRLMCNGIQIRHMYQTASSKRVCEI